MTEHERPSFPYRAVLATLKPLKAMREQWRGMAIMSGILIPTVAALVTWIFMEQRSRVDELEAELRMMQPQIENILRDCKHVSPERMLKLDTKDNELTAKTGILEKEVERLKKRKR